MSGGQMVLLFVHTLVVCLAVVGVWFYYRKHLMGGASGGPAPDEAPPPAPPALVADASVTAAKPPSDYPYRRRALMDEERQAVYQALCEQLSGETTVFPLVAAWGWIESAKPGDGYFARLAGGAFDFLLCDSMTLQPFCAVMVKDAASRNGKTSDPDFRRACQAADVTLLEIDPAAIIANPASVKSLLGIPEL